MAFRDVVGQELATAFLRCAAEAGRLAHAYIFVGPEGVGKRALARALAQYLFCKSRKDDACGECRNCRLVASGNYPDFHWVVREEGKRDVKVEQIEQMLREVNLKPAEGDHKVFVIEEADRLNPSSANRLLKVIEEPPPNTLLLLLALDVRDFLPTILSRCQVLRLRPVPAQELSRRLEKESGIPSDRARYLAHFTLGSPGLAQELVAGSFFEDRAWLIGLMSAARPEAHFAVVDEIDKRIGGEKDELQSKREVLMRWLDVLALFYRDVYAAALHCGDDLLINEDRTAEVKRLAARLSADRAERIVEAVERAREALIFNANRKLLLENLVFDVAQLQAI